MKTSLTTEEREMVYLLASQLTGTCQEGNFRHEILVTNVLRRMHKVNVSTLEDYLEYVEDHPKEMPFLLSALTIHTTNWFREKPHYDRFTGLLSDFVKKHPGETFKMLSAACSTGEEVYSFGLVLEEFAQKNPGFSYEVYGRDIDPVSVKKAERCVYPIAGLKDIPTNYNRFLLKGTGKTEGLFTVDKKIRSNCHFRPRSLTDESPSGDPKFHYVVCRNVLIYFSPEEVDQIVKRLLASLTDDGVLTVGHSEALDYRKYQVISEGHSTYKKGVKEKKKPVSRASTSSGVDRSKFESSSSNRTSASASQRVPVSRPGKYRVLVVDDSTTVRNMMMKLINGARFECVGAEDAFKADEILKSGEEFDIITLDLHMPGKDGHEWLLEKRKEGMKTPVVIVSDANPAEAQAVLNVLGNGAQDYIEKKDLGEQKQLIQDRLKALVENKELVAAERENHSRKHEVNASKVETFKPDLLVLGASTGGTEALVRTLKSLPSNCPPVVVVQHISVDFSEAFATRLASQAGLTLAEHKEQELKPGHLYMSTKDEHIGIVKKGPKIMTQFSNGPKVTSHRPSVDFMFESVAKLKDQSVVAALLTGMGKDGARGLLDLKRKGAVTMCQDAETSIVWGMPGEATKIGAPVFVGPTEDIRKVIDNSLSAPSRKKAA